MDICDQLVFRLWEGATKKRLNTRNYKLKEIKIQLITKI
jgi:hypothetical protein